MKPTTQQQKVIDLVATKSNRIKIGACAGGGKTSTLNMVAMSQQVPSLYLTFNKDMAEEAATKFPDHVTCLTTHSLAYRGTGGDYRHKLNFKTTTLKNNKEVSNEFKLSDYHEGELLVFSKLALASLIRATVTRFEQSSDTTLELKHIPASDKKIVVDALGGKNTIDVTKIKKVVLKHSRKLWDLRASLTNDVLATHDTYLKVFQLSNPTLNYQIIYLDESQDSSDCLLDIIKKQACKVVLVGDEYQSIYGWRGAVNAMSKVICPEVLLSRSFRYGKVIADIATAILQDEMIVEGSEHIESELLKQLPDSYTKLYRTNAALISEALSLMDKGKSVRIDANTKDFVNRIKSLIALEKGNLDGVYHHEIQQYSSWNDFVYNAENGDEDAETLYKLYKGAKNKIDTIIRLLDNYKAPRKYDILLTTAHKSKGQEYDYVVLADDFPDMEKLYQNDQERNLLYVAATRAVKGLYINTTVAQILERRA